MPSVAENFRAGLGAFDGVGETIAAGRQANKDRALRAQALEMERELSERRLALEGRQESRLQATADAGIAYDKRRLELAEAEAKRNEEASRIDMARARFGLKSDKFLTGLEATFAPAIKTMEIGLLGARLKEAEAGMRAEEARTRESEQRMKQRQSLYAEDRSYASDLADQVFMAKESQYGISIPTQLRRDTMDALTRWLQAYPEAGEDAITNVLRSLEGKIDTYARKQAGASGYGQSGPATPAAAPPVLSPMTPLRAQTEAAAGGFMDRLLRGQTGGPLPTTPGIMQAGPFYGGP